MFFILIFSSFCTIFFHKRIIGEPYNKLDSIRFIVLSFVSFSISQIFYFFISDYSLTNYEEFIISFELSLVISLIDSIFVKKLFLDDAVLKTSLIMSLGVCLYSIFTFGQSWINSDIATASLLSKCIVDSGSFFPGTWNYANGEIWGPLSIQSFVLVPTVLLENQPLARMIGSFLINSIAVISIFYFCKLFFNDSSWVISIPSIFLFLISSTSRDVILYQASYSTLLIWTPLCILLSYDIFSFIKLEKKKYKKIIVLSFITICLLIGGIRRVAEIFLPLVLSYCVVLCIDTINSNFTNYKNNIIYFSKMLFVIISPCFIGYEIYKWLCTWHNVNNTANNQMIFAASLSEIWNNVLTVFSNFYECFGYFGNVSLFSIDGIVNLVSMNVCTIMCFVVPFLQWKKIKEEDNKTQFFFIFSFIHNLILLFLIIFFSKTSKRYLLSTIFLQILISSRFIYNYYMKSKDIKRFIWIFIFLIASLFDNVFLANCSFDWVDNTYKKIELNNHLLSLGLNKGYAGYWNAYNNEIYSNLNIEYGGVEFYENGIIPFTWLVDSNVYNADKDVDSFLLLNEDEKEVFDYYLSDNFKKPKDCFNENDLYIYVFDYDISVDFNNGLMDGIIKPKELYVKEKEGIIERNHLLLYPGGKSYGPYTELKKGLYRITFTGYNLNNCSFSAFSNTSNDSLIFEIIEIKSGTVLAKLTAINDIDDLEFVINNNSLDRTVCLREIEVD